MLAKYGARLLHNRNVFSAIRQTFHCVWALAWAAKAQLYYGRRSSGLDMLYLNVIICHYLRGRGVKEETPASLQYDNTSGGHSIKGAGVLPLIHVPAPNIHALRRMHEFQWVFLLKHMIRA